MHPWSRRAASSVVLFALGLVGCDGNKAAPPAASATAAPSASAPASAAAPASSAAAPVLPEREIAGAAQILVTWKGADLAPKTVTRTKEAARKIAEEAAAKIKKDKMPFEEAAKKYSDDEGSKNIGGAIGNFEKNAMPEAFSKATFAMKVGEISDVVETPRGYHVIKRTR